MSFYTEEVEFLARNFDVVDDVKNDYDTAYACFFVGKEFLARNFELDQCLFLCWHVVL
jgi:hypothetical protein